MNTLQKGSIRYIVFKDKNCWKAAGLELNIVESGDDPRIALLNLFEAIEGYVASCRKVKGSRLSPLNQKPDSEYEHLWKIATAPKEVRSPYVISTFGVTRL